MKVERHTCMKWIKTFTTTHTHTLHYCMDSISLRTSRQKNVNTYRCLLNVSSSGVISTTRAPQICCNYVSTGMQGLHQCRSAATGFKTYFIIWCLWAILLYLWDSSYLTFQLYMSVFRFMIKIFFIMLKST